MKTCTKCGAEKPLSEFHKDKTKKDGYNHRCKSCIKEYSRKYRQDNFEKLSESKRKYRQENIDRILERDRKWYEENRVSEMERNRKHRANKQAEKMMWAAMDMAGMIDNG